MTNYYMALTRGAVDIGPDQVVEGTSSDASADFEFRVLSTNTPTRLDMILALEAFRRYIEDGRPAALPYL